MGVGVRDYAEWVRTLDLKDAADSKDNQTITITITPPSGVAVAIITVLAGYSDRTITQVLELREVSTVKLPYPIHGGDGFTVLHGIRLFAAGSVVNVVLPASGTGGKFGYLYVSWVYV